MIVKRFLDVDEIDKYYNDCLSKYPYLNKRDFINSTIHDKIKQIILNDYFSTGIVYRTVTVSNNIHYCLFDTFGIIQNSTYNFEIFVNKHLKDTVLFFTTTLDESNEITKILKLESILD